jgi:hypothetical protein
VQQANLLVKFLLELAALVAFGWWGSSVGNGVVPVVVAIGLPIVVAVLWALLAAPRASRRLPIRVRLPFELGVFALATLAFAGGGSAAAAVVFACIAAANAVLLTVWRQWEA